MFKCYLIIWMELNLVPPVILLTITAFSINKISSMVSQLVCKLQEYITVCSFYFHLVVTKLHAIFLTYLFWKSEIRIWASVWSSPPIQSHNAEVWTGWNNRMKLVLIVIDDFQPHISQKFLLSYITPVWCWLMCCIIFAALPW